MNKTEKFWDRLAKDIDEKSDQLDQGQIRTVKNIEKHIKNTDVVLDYGCARGGIALGIADKVKEVHGIDISSKMIEIAKKRADTRKITNADFTHAQIFNNSYKRESFNVILALNIFHLVEEPDKIMQKINELLKPGGLFISETPCSGGKRNILSGIVNLLIAIVVKIGIIPHVNIYKISELETIISKAEFKIIETKSLQESFATSRFIVAKKI